MILVDTDVLIAHLRGVESARDWLIQTRTNGPISASAITVAEITGGMRSGERREVRALLSVLVIHPVTDAIARRAGEHMRQYRRSHSNVDVNDYLIAATAELHGLSLATLNVRHFPMMKGLRPPFAV